MNTEQGPNACVARTRPEPYTIVMRTGKSSRSKNPLPGRTHGYTFTNIQRSEDSLARIRSLATLVFHAGPGLTRKWNKLQTKGSSKRKSPMSTTLHRQIIVSARTHGNPADRLIGSLADRDIPTPCAIDRADAGTRQLLPCRSQP